MNTNINVTDNMSRETIKIKASPNEEERAKRMFLSAISQIGKIKRGDRIKQVYTWEEVPVETYNYWVTIAKDSV